MIHVCRTNFQHYMTNGNGSIYSLQSFFSIQEKERGGPPTKEDLESCVLNKVSISSIFYSKPYPVGIQNILRGNKSKCKECR